MRPLEILLLGLLVVAVPVMLLLRRRWREVADVVPLLVAGTSLAQITFEGLRWSMLGAHAAAAVLCVLYLVRRMRPEPAPSRGRTALRVGGTVALLLLVAVSGALAMTFRVVRLPDPTGPHAVGTTTLRIVDTARPETLTDDPSDTRAFDVRVWYPARPARDAEPVVYRPVRPAVGTIQEGGLPDFIFRDLRFVRTHAYADAPAADAEPFPVVVYSTGFLSPLDEGQVLAEELASRGWVVLSMSHPYESASVVHDDGRAVPFSAGHLASYRSHLATVAPHWATFWGTHDASLRRALADSMIAADTFMRDAVLLRAADVRVALDSLAARAAAGDALAGTMDLARVAAVGHSLGGATATQLLLDEPRVRAAVNMDGFVFGDIAADTLRRPYLLLYSEPFAGANEFVFERLGPAATVLTIAGSTHMDFTDNAIVFPVARRTGAAGPIAEARMRRILHTWVTAFLDAHVRDRPGALDSIESFAEVRAGEPLR